MTSRIGENIQREWDEDPAPDKLWDALRVMDKDPEAAIPLLIDLAANGSSLSMVYLGSAYLSGTLPVDKESGETWLKKSADLGSIEGGYQLARFYEIEKRTEEAREWFASVAERGYSPALYRLGCLHYYAGDIPEALHYLHKAKDAGNLPARGTLSWIYRKENLGLAKRLVSHWHCAAKIPAVTWLLFRYRLTDRLRGNPRLDGLFR